MKRAGVTVAVLVGVITSLVGCLNITRDPNWRVPTWAAAHVTSLRVLNERHELLLAADPLAIERIVGSFRAAQEGERRSWRHSRTTHYLDIEGKKPEAGRWLYDAGSGEFTYLGPSVLLLYPVFRLSDEAREKMNVLLQTSRVARSSRIFAPDNPDGHR